MKKRMIFLTVIVILLIGAIFAYRHFVLERSVDVPGMENPARPILELLNAEWMSEDGVWNAHIGGKEGNTFDLSCRQELVYSGNFSLGSQGDDLNVKTELDFYDKQFKSEDGSISGTIESLYVENCRMYLDITSSKKGEDSIRQQVVLNRVEYVKPTENESEKIQEVSEMKKLVEFSWHQSAMSYDGCFDFQITFSEQGSAAPHLYCNYTDPETYERIEIGEECSGFQWMGMGKTETEASDEVCPTIPLERWEELADYLRKAELPDYSPPPTGLMDATDSNIHVTWWDGGKEFSNSYDGTYAHDLLKLLQDIAEEVYRKALEEPKQE
ncbi:MAG: hypothetical protein ACI4J6_11030 [Oscillospiraceae bacterium]